VLYAKQRRINELEARCTVLRRKLDEKRSVSESTAPAATVPVVDWEGVAKQLASDRTKAERAGQWRATRLEADLDGWIELAALGARRVARLVRACARYRQTIAALQRDLRSAKVRTAQETERANKLDAQLATLERANQDFDWRYAVHPDAQEPAAA
jgi:chromosome segregation ATPase